MLTEQERARLAEIAEREKAATPGNWEHINLPCECGDCENQEEPSCTAGYITGPKGKSIYTVDCGDHFALSHPDSFFIAHSREDIPYLLSLVHRLAARLEESEARRTEGVAVLSKAMEAVEVCCERSRTVAEQKACINAKRAFSEYLACSWESGK